MKIRKLPIDVPSGFIIVKHDLTDYDPLSNFSEENNLKYLGEDLVHLSYNTKGLIIDLGWYGDLIQNDGAFKIYLIQNGDWENPIEEFESESIMVIYKKLLELIKERGSD